MRELESNLIDKIKSDDLQSILLDYAEIFESNSSENKTEDETSDEIGSPASVAKNILDDYTSLKSASPNSENDYQIAPIGKRLVAFMIDSILSLLPIALFAAGPGGIINALFVAPLVPSLPLFFAVPFQPTAMQITINLILLSFFWVYGTASMILLKNKTVGMHIMHMKVIKANNSTLRISDIMIRQFLGKIIIPSITFGISNFGSFIWMLFSKTNNTVQDRISGTLVVEDFKEHRVK